jgi:hypothetical protein
MTKRVFNLAAKRWMDNLTLWPSLPLDRQAIPTGLRLRGTQMTWGVALIPLLVNESEMSKPQAAKFLDKLSRGLYSSHDYIIQGRTMSYDVGQANIHCPKTFFAVFHNPSLIFMFTCPGNGTNSADPNYYIRPYDAAC